MATGSVPLTVSGSNAAKVDAEIYYSYTTGQGSTSLTCTMRTRFNGGSGTYDNQARWSMTINGVTYTDGSPGTIDYRDSNGSWKNIITKTITISHTAAKAVAVSGSFTISSTYVSGASGSGTITLPASVAPVKINDTPIYKVNFNGQEVKTLIFNGITVFAKTFLTVNHPTSALTSNTAPSPYNVYYSSRYSANYAAWKAFTNSISAQGWASNTHNYGSTAWIALDLGAGNEISSPKVSLWNRGNANVNGPYNITIYGTNTTPSSSDGDAVAAMPTDAMILGTFTGLDGDTEVAAAVLDTVGNETSGCTRSSSYVSNAKNNKFRYIIVSSTSWNTDGGTYLSIGQIRIAGLVEE